MAGISTIAYCEDQDIYDLYPRISQYDYKVKLIGEWSKSGHKYTLEDFKFISDELNLVGTDRIIQLYVNGKDIGSPRDAANLVTSNDRWYMLLSIPRIIYYNDTTSPNNMVMELGEDIGDLMQRFRRKASRMIESFLGSSISREIMKDREGNYPSSIIQATALKTTILFLSAYNPNNPDLIPLKDEYDDIIDKIRSGKIVMTGHRSPDDCNGTIREVFLMGITGMFKDFGRLFPTELKGRYFGSEYELLKIKIDGTAPTNLGIGTATFSVWGKSSTNLKQTLLVDSKIINGDYQSLGVNDLKVRFGGKYMTLTEVDGITFESKAFSTEEWEIELWGQNIQPAVSHVNSISMTKRSDLWR